MGSLQRRQARFKETVRLWGNKSRERADKFCDLQSVYV
jgi:hypothetical protein